MRLVNMEVDQLGTTERLGLGPFSPGLNAIYGPPGSGKSQLLAWLRVLANDNRAPAPFQAGNYEQATTAGSAEFENQGGQYRVTTDRNGRVRFDYIGQGPATYADQRWDGRIDQSIASNLTNAQQQAFLGMLSASGVYDTEAALQQVAQQLGIDQPVASEPNAALLARQREIETQLQRVSDLRLNRETLVARQRQLEAELAGTANGKSLKYTGVGIERERLEHRFDAIEVDLQQVLHDLEAVERDIAAKEAELKLLEVGSTTVAVGESFREQLQQLDDRLNRWRQTLRDLKSHRESIESNSTDARLDKQIGDQLSSSKDADPRAAMRSLEAQIMNTRQQLDLLVDRYTNIPGYDYRSASAAVNGTGYQPGDTSATSGIYRDASGRTYLGHPTHLPESTMLPETLRAMQKDLHEVCQQLARHEAKTATETLRQQSMQLKRCESELLESVEKLIEERAALLRRIANEHHLSIEQLTLAFGDWCQCHDHPHLYDWLLSEEGNRSTTCGTHDPVARQSVLEHLENLKQQRKTLTVRADECRRQLRDAHQHRRTTTVRRVESHGRPEVEIRQDLQQVSADLSAIAERERLEAELVDIRARIGSVRPETRMSNFRVQMDRHIKAMMAHAPTAPQTYSTPSRSYDLVDGVITEEMDRSAQANRYVPAEIVRLAMRIAIADEMTRRGEQITLVVDCAVDNLPLELQRAVVNYLAGLNYTVPGMGATNGFASHQQQILMMTSSQQVAELVASAGGWVGSITNRTAARVSPGTTDINDQLHAYANDAETDKWIRPDVKPTSGRSGYYLTEQSIIEDLPAIDPELANRCRAYGIDRIGDLLDVDAVWLADQIRVKGVSERTVMAWQSVASLLCSVRNLRPFDARVLVGAGIQSPDHLAEMHPSQLLQRVERFLTTSQGRKILSSGNSYELSRITAWIASAEGGDYEADRDYTRNGRSSRRSYANGSSRSYPNRSRSSRSQRNGYRNATNGTDYDTEREREYEREPVERDAYESEYGSRSRSQRSGRSRTSSNRSSRSTRSTRSSRSSQSYPVISRDSEPRQWEERESRNNGSERTSRKRTVSIDSEIDSSESTLKFYLELASPVVDAPSIGPRMASRLEEHNILTVDQLLVASAEELADKLDHRRVDADVIRAWQEQARLVCRIPNLRGHDAQMLVACEFTSPEDLANMNASEVLDQVSAFAQSKEGQRVLRGSKDPDLEEVNDWISWASQSRQLNAA